MGYFIKKDRFGVTPKAGSTAERPTVPVAGSIRYNTDTLGMEYHNGTDFVELAKTGLANTLVDKFISDGVNDTFTMSFSESNANNILVFIEGIHQSAPVNYTVSGTDILFSSVPPADLVIIVVHGLGSTYVESGNVFDVPNL